MKELRHTKGGVDWPALCEVPVLERRERNFARDLRNPIPSAGRHRARGQICAPAEDQRQNSSKLARRRRWIYLDSPQ